MVDNISNVSFVVQLLSLIILVTTSLTLIIAAFSYAAYKLRKRVPMSEGGEAPVYFERYEPRLGLHGPAQGIGTGLHGTPVQPGPSPFIQARE